MFLRDYFLGFFISVVLLPSVVLGQYWGPHYHEGTWHGSYMGGVFGGWWMFIVLIFFILLILAILIVLYILFRRSSKPDDRALNILREKYAKGEINEEEFEKKRNNLKSEK